MDNLSLAMNSTKPILLCVDGSPYTASACRYAAWLSVGMGSAVELLYVSDLDRVHTLEFADLSSGLGMVHSSQFTAQSHYRELSKMQEIEGLSMQALRDAGVPEAKISFHYKTGAFLDTITHLEDRYAGIVLGKRGERTGSDGRCLGAAIESVVRKSNIPVLLSSLRFANPHHLLVAYDGGPASHRALDFVIENMMGRGFRVSVATVAEDNEPEKYAQILREAEQRLESRYRSLVDFQILGGEPEAAIAQYVREQAIDLLLMGAYGHSRLRNFFKGSTTGALIEACRIPILCFR